MKIVKTFEAFLGDEPKRTEPITKDDLKDSDLSSHSPYYDDFVEKFLNDIKDTDIELTDAVFFLSKIFRHYDYEPSVEQYKAEMEIEFGKKYKN